MHAPQTRRERERLSRRNAILEAAQKEFAEKGYAQAKLEDIAKRAEFGKGTLYNYFKGGKQGMLFASFDQLFDDSEALIHESFSKDIMKLNHTLGEIKNRADLVIFWGCHPAASHPRQA